MWNPDNFRSGVSRMMAQESPERPSGHSQRRWPKQKSDSNSWRARVLPPPCAPSLAKSPGSTRSILTLRKRYSSRALSAANRVCRCSGFVEFRLLGDHASKRCVDFTSTTMMKRTRMLVVCAFYTPGFRRLSSNSLMLKATLMSSGASPEGDTESSMAPR